MTPKNSRRFDRVILALILGIGGGQWMLFGYMLWRLTECGCW